MSYDKLSGIEIRKILVEKENDQNETQYMFFLKSASSNVSPQTYNWWLGYITPNENDLKSYLQKWMGDFSGGSIKLNNSNIKSNNEFGYYNIFMKKTLKLLKNSEYFQFEGKDIVIKKSDFENKETLRILNSKLRKGFTKKIDSYSFNEVFSSYSLSEEKLKNHSKRVFEKNNNNSNFSQEIEDLINNIMENKKYILTVNSYKKFEQINLDLNINESLKYEFQRLYLSELRNSITLLNKNEINKLNKEIMLKYFLIQIERSKMSYVFEDILLFYYFNFDKTISNYIESIEGQTLIDKLILEIENSKKTEKYWSYKEYENSINNLKSNSDYLNDLLENNNKDLKKYIVSKEEIEKIEKEITKNIKKYLSDCRTYELLTWYLDSFYNKLEKNLITYGEYINTDNIFNNLSNLQNTYLFDDSIIDNIFNFFKNPEYNTEELNKLKILIKEKFNNKPTNIDNVKKIYSLIKNKILNNIENLDDKENIKRRHFYKDKNNIIKILSGINKETTNYMKNILLSYDRNKNKILSNDSLNLSNSFKDKFSNLFFIENKFNNQKENILHTEFKEYIEIQKLKIKNNKSIQPENNEDIEVVYF
jgi:hypothetical protein